MIIANTESTITIMDPVSLYSLAAHEVEEMRVGVCALLESASCEECAQEDQEILH